MNFLRFTQEIGEDFPDLKLPSLDTTIWVERNSILLKFFSSRGAFVLLFLLDEVFVRSNMCLSS